MRSVAGAARGRGAQLDAQLVQPLPGPLAAGRQPALIEAQDVARRGAPTQVADLADGLLDSCTVNPISRPTMMRLLPSAMKGTHITSPHVVMRRSRNIVVQSNMALPIHADGEILAYHEDNVRRFTLATLPSALTIRGAAPST